MPHRSILMLIGFLTSAVLLLSACGGGPPVVITVVVTAAPTATADSSTQVAQAPSATAASTETSALPSATDSPVLTVTSPPVGSCTSDSQFVTDITVPDGTAVAAGTTFVKTWRVKNSGTCAWDNGFAVVFVSGPFDKASAPIPNAAPGAVVDVSIQVKAPADPGKYSGQWQLRTSGGALFGTSLTTVLVVPGPTNTPAPTLPPLPDITQIEGDHADAQILSPGYAPFKNFPPAKTGLFFQVKARDTRSGKNDGDGVDNVEFHISDENGTEVYSHVEKNVPFCAFSDNGTTCYTYIFADNGYKWPNNGPAIVNGTFTLDVQVNTKRGDHWNASLDFQIQY